MTGAGVRKEAWHYDPTEIDAAIDCLIAAEDQGMPPTVNLLVTRLGWGRERAERVFGKILLMKVVPAKAFDEDESFERHPNDPTPAQIRRLCEEIRARAPREPASVGVELVRSKDPRAAGSFSTFPKKTFGTPNDRDCFSLHAHADYPAG